MANNKFYGFQPKYKDGVESIAKLDRLNPYEFRKGMDYELTALGCARLQESTPEEREKATETVLKNLESNGGYYTSLITYETLFRNTEGVKPSFTAWLKEQENIKMQEVNRGDKDSKHKGDKMTDKFKYNKSDYTVPFKTAALKEAITKEIKKVLNEQEDEDFDDDIEKADKAATKTATRTKSNNRFDLEKEAIKNILYRGKKGKDSEYTEEEPAPKSILAVKDDMLQTYKSKFKGKEGGLDEYKALLKKTNEKFKKVLEKHIKSFGEEGKGNKVTLDLIYGEDLPATIKLLGARLKELDKEEQEELITKTNERREIASTDMTREQHIKLLEIIRENGISLREGAMGVKTYYEIAKAAYLEGVANGMKL